MKVSLKDISNDCFHRCDYKFHQIQNSLNRKWIKLNLIFDIINGISCTEYYSEDKTDLPFLRIGNLSFQEEIEEDNLIYLDQIPPISKEKILQKDDLILATIGNTVGKINSANNFLGGIFSNNTVVLRLKNKDHHSIKFLERLIKNQNIQTIIWSFISQKAQPNLQNYYLKNISVPNIPLETQNQTVAKIEPIEQQIKELKSQIIDQKLIINEVFAQEFGFDMEQFEKLKQENKTYINFSDFANNKDIRQSVKFHRQVNLHIYEELKNITNKKIKDFISQPIALGSGISPKNYDSYGAYYYISMASIKNWKFDSENIQCVSDSYYSDNKDKTVQKNDILIARSGEGTIGKVALLSDDAYGIFSDFTMRIRLQDYNTLFAYYYFRTEYFQYLIEVNKKGLGNNTNIFPSQIQEFPILDIPLSHQQEIVNKVQTKIDAQNKITKQIQALRNKIDDIMNEVIHNAH